MTTQSRENAIARYNRIMNPIKVASNGDYSDYIPSDAMLAYHRLGEHDLNRNVAIQDMAIDLCQYLSQRERENNINLLYAIHGLTDDESLFLAHFVWADSRQWLSVMS